MTKGMKWAVVCCLAMVMQVMAGAGGLIGIYDVQGWTPEGDRASTPDYKGVLTIKKLGDAYILKGELDEISYDGIGVKGTGSSFSFAYQNAQGEVGEMKGQDKNGIWVVFRINIGSLTGSLGQEIWSKRPEK